MSNHLRSVRVGAMKWANLWTGTQPASVFMLKWLVFVDLPRAQPRLSDWSVSGAKTGKKHRAHCPISKRHLHLYWFDRRVCQELSVYPLSCILSPVLSRPIFGHWAPHCMLSEHFSGISSWEKPQKRDAGISSALPLRCAIVALLADGSSQTHTHKHKHTHTHKSSASVSRIHVKKLPNSSWRSSMSWNKEATYRTIMH